VTTTIHAQVDVVIPTFQNREELEACLGSLARQSIHGITAIVCVDGSTDDTLDFLSHGSIPLRLRVLEHRDRRNHGRAAARNLAMPHLAAKFVVLLDSDMQLEPDAIERHLDVLWRGPSVSVGAVLYANANQNLWARYQGTRGMNKAATGSRIRPLDFVTANTALLTEDLIAAGGFDETLAGYGGEDTELALRLDGVLHRQFWFNAKARAVTFEKKTYEDALQQLRQYAATNLRATRQRHPNSPAPFWIDRAESNRVRHRLFRAFLNPVSDKIAHALLPKTPFVIQRRLLDYLVIRTVFRGFAEGSR
jgi:glycosyltransferase involved in cell wall biosynthesis